MPSKVSMHGWRRFQARPKKQYGCSIFSRFEGGRRLYWRRRICRGHPPYQDKKIYDILNRETFRVHKEKEAFNDVAKKLEHVHFAETLKLNIGGQLFTTSLATVRKDRGSILQGMFSERFDSKPAEDGSYFIDRDGTHFRYILNYLRTGQLIVPEDKIIRRELFTEAKFYQVQGMI